MTGFPSVGKHEQKDRFEKGAWYQLDLGEDRSGFVNGKDVMSAAGHQRKLEWEEFIYKLEDFVADARRQNTGPYASRAGIYVLNKTAWDARQAAKPRHCWPDWERGSSGSKTPAVSQMPFPRSRECSQTARSSECRTGRATGGPDRSQEEQALIDLLAGARPVRHSEERAV